MLNRDMLRNFPRKIIRMVDQFADKQIKFSNTGARFKSIDIETSDEPTKVHPPEYRKNSYNEMNRCVWLSKCILIRSQDSELSDHLLRKYKANCGKYECLRVREKGTRGYPNLNAYLPYDKTCYLDVRKITVPEVFLNDPTTYVLSPTTEGLFVVVLLDTNGGRSHTVRINSGLKIIYCSMESYKLILNVQNINKYV